MKSFVAVLCLTVCIILAGGPAQAVPITFDFSANPVADGLYSEIDLQNSGVKVHIFATDEDDKGQTVSKLGSGLGVFSGGTESKVLDGSGPDEWLHFNFDAPVKLLQVMFSLVQATDGFSLWVDGALVNSEAIPLTGLADFAVAGSRFDFGVMDNDDDYRIKKIVVDDFSVAPVPEPASWVLLSLGLAVLSTRVRRDR